MANRACFALLLGVAPLIGLTQLDAQPTTNLVGNGSNVSSSLGNDSVDADTPADTSATTTNTVDDGPPK